MASVVSVKNVVKGYVRGKQRVEVLHGLNLEVESGEFLALMGPSGSGKSTLLNLIGGLDRPTQGSVRVAGQNLESLSDKKLAAWRARHVGLVFQFYNLMPVLSAERNVELPLLLTNLSKSRRKKQLELALSVVGLSHRMNHLPSQLSGGEQQRVGIARAIATDPTLLLCDEPTGDLDRKSGDEILDLLVSAVHDKDGNYISAMLSWSVVTEKVKADAESFRLEQMVATMPVNVMMLEIENFTITYANETSISTLKTLEHLLPSPSTGCDPRPGYR